MKKCGLRNADCGMNTGRNAELLLLSQGGLGSRSLPQRKQSRFDATSNALSSVMRFACLTPRPARNASRVPKHVVRRGVSRSPAQIVTRSVSGEDAGGHQEAKTDLNRRTLRSRRLIYAEGVRDLSPRVKAWRNPGLAQKKSENALKERQKRFGHNNLRQGYVSQGRQARSNAQPNGNKGCSDFVIRNPRSAIRILSCIQSAIRNPSGTLVKNRT
jgi:hypothetical protein